MGGWVEGVAGVDGGVRRAAPFGCGGGDGDGRVAEGGEGGKGIGTDGVGDGFDRDVCRVGGEFNAVGAEGNARLANGTVEVGLCDGDARVAVCPEAHGRCLEAMADHHLFGRCCCSGEQNDDCCGGGDAHCPCRALLL